MVFIRFFPTVVLTLAVTAFAAFPVIAQEQEAPLKIAIIDIDAIQRNAAVVKDIRAQMGKFRSAFQAEIQKEEKELRNSNQELARQRAILSPEAFAEERQKFEKRLIAVQRKVQQRKQDLETIQGTAMKTVRQALHEIITNLAKEKNLTLILRENQVILAIKALKITAVVLERLDRKLPSLKVSETGK